METVLGRGSAQNCFDAPFGEVNPSHSVVFCVDHKQSLLVVDHQPLWPVEGCLERFSLITRVSFLAGAGDMVQFVRGSIDPPNTVAFAECNPNRFRIDRKRPWTKQRRGAQSAPSVGSAFSPVPLIVSTLPVARSIRRSR